LEPTVTDLRKFILISIVAVLLPAALIAKSILFAQSTAKESAALFFMNWALMASPQLLVVGIALVFAAARGRFATRAQIGLSILVGLFLYVTSLDANGPMLWVFYLPLSALLLLVVAFTLPSRVSMPAGSDKRHT
jgi:hypothetical protein